MSLQILSVMLLGAWRGAFRVIRGRGGRYSNRLVCRILIDETEAARLTLLDADLEVDAQGRIDEPTDRPPSAATLVLFRERLYHLVRCDRRVVGWIGSIQQERHAYEADPLCSADAPQDAELRQIMGILCELEAEARRQSGDLYGCIAVRSRQVRHRLAEHIQVPESCDWEIVTKLVPEPGSGDTAPTMDRLRKIVESERFVEVLKQIVLRHAAYQIQDSSPAVANDGFRLLEHIQDIAVCMKSLRVDPLRVGDLLEIVQESTKNVEEHISSPARPLAQQIQVQTAFRLIDLWTAHLAPWRLRQEDEQRLDYCRLQFEQGQHLLLGYPGLRDRDDSRFTCFLNTVGAATAYLRRQFTLAYHLLDAAEAVVWPQDRGSDRTSIAVCHLHRAEALMLHADYQLRKGTGLNSAVRGPGVERDVWGSARGKLESARTELVQAHELLIEGRPNRWWWTWLHLLFAQWHHEWFALRLDAPHPNLWPNGKVGSSDGAPFDVSRQRYLNSALYSIRDGLDCVGFDGRRREEFHILWWQHFICHVFHELQFADNFWNGKQSFHDDCPIAGVEPLFDDWLQRCEEAGLGSFAQTQEEEYRKAMETWSARDWSDIEAISSKRSNAYIHECRSLRNSLLTVEDQLLTAMLKVHSKKGVGRSPHTSVSG